MFLLLNRMLVLLLFLGLVPGNPWRNSGADGPAMVYLPLVNGSVASGSSPLLISALYYDTYISGEPDEAFQIYNTASAPMQLEGWQVTDGTHSLSFPDGFELPSRAKMWCARQA